MRRIHGIEPRLHCGILEPILRQTKQGLEWPAGRGLAAAQVTWAMLCLSRKLKDL